MRWAVDLRNPLFLVVKAASAGNPPDGHVSHCDAFGSALHLGLKNSTCTLARYRIVPPSLVTESFQCRQQHSAFLTFAPEVICDVCLWVKQASIADTTDIARGVPSLERATSQRDNEYGGYECKRDIWHDSFGSPQRDDIGLARPAASSRRTVQKLCDLSVKLGSHLLSLRMTSVSNCRRRYPGSDTCSLQDVDAM